MKRILFLCSLLINFSVEAAQVDTVEVYSQAMNKKIKVVVISPSDYKTLGELPVVYLLHGFGDDYATWSKNVPAIKADADLYKFFIVCPDGSKSWYFDSPVDPTWKYETFMSRELVQWIDKNYKTKKDRGGRAITGLSMGGHGGLFLSIRHQDVFGAGGSMSGGVDIRPFPNNWDMALRLGTYAEHRQNWEENTVMNLLPLIKPNSLALVIECGTGDFFYAVNERLHQELLYRNIAHDYTTRPGVHNWAYWSNAVHYQLLFFHRFFSNAKQ
jgi:S-formylglutathione hydrolase FrmB